MVKRKEDEEVAKDRVAITIPVFGRMALLHACLSSLWENTVAPYRLCVVDNGSAYNVHHYLWEKHEQIDFLVLSPVNLGKPHALNIGVRLFEQSNRRLEIEPPEFLVFADSDCYFEKGWLTTLLKVFDVYKDQPLGIVGGWCPNPIKRDQFHLYREKLGLRFTKAVPGLLHMLRREVVLDIGLHSTHNIIPGIDVSYCKRSLEKGYKNAIVPGLLKHLGKKHRSWKLGSENEPIYVP